MRRSLLSAAIAIALFGSALGAFARESEKAASKADNASEPVFVDVVPGTLPLNLRPVRVVQAFADKQFDMTKTPAMCLARLSALVDAAGGTDSVNQYLSSDKSLNVSFQSYIGGEITFHCSGNDGSGLPNRKLYSISFDTVPKRPDDFIDIVHRVGERLYGWKAADLKARIAECTNKAKRRLQKDAFGVIPEYGSVRGLECYLTSRPRLVLYSPDSN